MDRHDHEPGSRLSQVMMATTDMGQRKPPALESRKNLPLGYSLIHIF